MTVSRPAAWPQRLAAGIRPYFEPAPLGALALGLSSGFPYAMIASTLTSRLAEAGVDKKSVTAFALALTLYNFKFLWSPLVERGRIPLLARLFGQRRAWLLVAAAMVMASVTWLGLTDPRASLGAMALAAIAVGFSGATYDIVIDAFRIESLRRDQLGVGSGMSQYGWRLGSAGAGALVLMVADRQGWSLGYVASIVFALPAVVAGFLLGEPERHEAAIADAPRRGWPAVRAAVIEPLADFLRRDGAMVALLFILFHKIGDTLANLTLRLLFNDLGFSKDEIAIYDVQLGLVAYLVGIFVGGLVFSRLGMVRSVFLSLLLMAVSNLGFSALAIVGHSNPALVAAMAFENFASGIGGVAVTAYLSALCNLRFTAVQFALLSAAASVVGRFLSAGSGGVLIETLGYVQFYLLTTLLALPGILIFAWMMRAGLADDVVAAAEPAPL